MGLQGIEHNLATELSRATSLADERETQEKQAHFKFAVNIWYRELCRTTLCCVHMRQSKWTDKYKRNAILA